MAAHSTLVPLDFVKTRLQSDPARYPDGPVAATKTIIREEGVGALMTGVGPTLTGYVAPRARRARTPLLRRPLLLLLRPNSLGPLSQVLPWRVVGVRVH